MNNVFHFPLEYLFLHIPIHIIQLISLIDHPPLPIIDLYQVILVLDFFILLLLGEARKSFSLPHVFIIAFFLQFIGK
jgi:hypothetical protein